MLRGEDKDNYPVDDDCRVQTFRVLIQAEGESMTY